MGKGDKKTKRGKIVIGSSGVRRARKKNKHVMPSKANPEPRPAPAVDAAPAEPAKEAARKSVKKTAENREVPTEKVKAVKTKKKSSETDENITPEA